MLRPREHVDYAVSARLLESVDQKSGRETPVTNAQCPSLQNAALSS